MEAAIAEGLRPPARRRQVGRACSSATSGGWPASPATTSSATRRLGPVPSAQVHARLPGRGRRRDRHPARAGGLGRGQVRRHPRPAPQARPDVRLYSRDLHDISTRLPRDRRGGAPLGWDGILDGEILGWRDGTVLPFIALQGRLGRKSPSARDPGRGAGHLRGLRRARRRRRRRRAGRAAPARCRWPSAGAALDALDLPLVADGGRFARSHLIVAADVDALEAAFADSRAPAQRGPDGQGPGQHLRAGPARPAAG